MPKFEQKFADFFTKHSSVLFFIVITVLGIAIRFVGKNFLSSDMYNFLIPWFDTMKEHGGLAGLKNQVGDYNVLYQTFIAVMTYIPLNPITQYKLLSCAFDFLLAFFLAAFACRLKQSPLFGTLFQSVYAVILFLPTVVFNSAFWGQCDSMYVFCLILVLLLMHKNKYLPAFIVLGISFALKFQTVFFLPFLVSFYFVKKKFSAGLFAVSALSFWLCGGVAYIFGRNPLSPFTVYFSQTQTYDHMYLNARSIWQLFGDDYPRLSGFAVLLTLGICGLGFYMILQKKKRMDSSIQILNTIAWFAWVCIFFLPAMHDRYAYFLDLILLLLAFLDKKYIKFAVFSLLLSFMAYPAFLIFSNGVTRADAFIEFFVFAYYTYVIMQPDENRPAEVSEAAR